MRVGHHETALPQHPTAAERPYLIRKRRLPNTLTNADWERALTYWDHRCAVCERPRGLWHTLAQDHWIPLTDANCPGTTAENILPLCHGEGGCNNSKGKKDPLEWLRAKLGTRRAKQKLYDIKVYLGWAHEHASRRLGCPKCGASVTYHEDDDLWLCGGCGVGWGDAFAHTMSRCPTCHCWMLSEELGGETLSHCPRCERLWREADLPLERCPGCHKGVLEWVTDEGGYWFCAVCGTEWENS